MILRLSGINSLSFRATVNMLPLFLVVFWLQTIGAMPVHQKEYRESVWTSSLIGDVGEFFELVN
jgi:hypothetical protein